jgi:acetyltransferase-like isoleucine patch superfamily enzyme
MSYSLYEFNAPFLGSIKDHIIDKNKYYIIGIANLQYRKKIVDVFLKAGATFLTLIHPSVYLSRSSKIGVGVVIAPNVNIGPNVQIGNFTLINARASIGHDTIIGEHNFITPNVCFSGFTTIGDENLFGINSASIPGIVVGNRNKIAAGMILDKNIGDDSVVFHRFKEKVIVIPKE